ncbi:MAG: NAD(P)-dependent oxidoreductase [Deltaproteobacteria bacterium]|nr:MAG: NAD(P)-dependent oxidoreductase [Deltaproteobacteria bacterium]
MKVLILGVTGMLGHTLFTQLSQNKNLEVYGRARCPKGLRECFTESLCKRIRNHADAENFDSITRTLASVRPDIVINCIGLIKQLPITINAQLPHRISMISQTAGVRMIHISTDCVFDGTKGNYLEADESDTKDLYGQTKFLGEVAYPHCVTLRTSVIGRELRRDYGLVDWFLSQKDKIRGFTKAIYSGFPTVELARIISDFVIPRKSISGLYHVSSEPISKYDLLKLVAGTYKKKKIRIEPFADFMVDRSLGSERFRRATGYVPPSWAEMVDGMCRHYNESEIYRRLRNRHAS